MPARHGDQGWFDFRPPDPYLYIHLYYLSQSERDLARLDEVFPDRTAFAGLPPDWGTAKAGICPPMAWFAFIEGKNRGYVDQAIDSTYLLQAGSFGEHQFTDARLAIEAGPEQSVEVEAPHLQVHLGPAAQARLHLGLKRFARSPSYSFPAF